MVGVADHDQTRRLGGDLSCYVGVDPPVRLSEPDRFGGEFALKMIMKSEQRQRRVPVADRSETGAWFQRRQGGLHVIEDNGITVARHAIELGDR